MERGDNSGDLPTVGDSRRLGLEALTLHCLRFGCGHTGRKTFDELGLADDVVFVHIVRDRRFVCSRCRGRRLEVMPDWRDHQAEGKGRRSVPPQSRT